jgi:hypothetical protein
MPRPTELRDQLEQGLRVHERLLASPNLRDREGHEEVLRLGRNRRVLAVLDELTEDREKFLTAVRNPRQFAQERDITISPNVGVMLAMKQEQGNEVWSLLLTLKDGRQYGFEGGDGGRGWVCGEEEPDDENGGGTGGGGGPTPP